MLSDDNTSNKNTITNLINTTNNHANWISGLTNNFNNISNTLNTHIGLDTGTLVWDNISLAANAKNQPFSSRSVSVTGKNVKGFIVMVRTVCWVGAGIKVYFKINLNGTYYTINYNNGNTGETASVNTLLVFGESFNLSATVNNYDTTARSFGLYSLYKAF